MEYQIYGRYGRKAGKPGRLTHFYSKVRSYFNEPGYIFSVQEFLMDQFRLKVLDGSDCFILAKRLCQHMEPSFIANILGFLLT